MPGLGGFGAPPPGGAFAPPLLQPLSRAHLAQPLPQPHQFSQQFAPPESYAQAPPSSLGPPPNAYVRPDLLPQRPGALAVASRKRRAVWSVPAHSSFCRAGFIGDIPPELRSGDGGALLRMLQRNEGGGGPPPPLQQHALFSSLPPAPPPAPHYQPSPPLESAFAGLRFAGAPIGPPGGGLYGAPPPHRPPPPASSQAQGAPPPQHQFLFQQPPPQPQQPQGRVPPPRPHPSLPQPRPQPLPQFYGVPPPPPAPAPPPPPPAPASTAPPRVNQREVREANLAGRRDGGGEPPVLAPRPARVGGVPPAPPALKQDARAAFNARLEALVTSLQPSEQHRAAQKAVFERVEALVRREWPDAQLLMYGSCANSFGGANSDVDTCLALRSAQGGRGESQQQLVELKRAAVARIAELAEEEGGFRDVQAITHARMPVAKLVDASSGVACDVCVNNFLAVLNTRMLRDYAALDPRLRQLVYAVKHWAKRRCVNEPYTGTLSSYCYVLMCIHLLQTRRPAILPCLQGLRHTFSREVEGHGPVGYCDDLRSLAGCGSGNSESVADLLLAFFAYWSSGHDYGQSVVCVRTGGLLTKRRKGWTTRVGTERHLICVEDPFEQSHDLGRVVDRNSIEVLRREFARAERILRTAPDPLETLFEPYVAPPQEEEAQ